MMRSNKFSTAQRQIGGGRERPSKDITTTVKSKKFQISLRHRQNSSELRLWLGLELGLGIGSPQR